MSSYVRQKDYQINTASAVAEHVSIPRIIIADINLPLISEGNRKKRIPYICETNPIHWTINRHNLLHEIFTRNKARNYVL